ncbi:hypothetical protein HXX76_007554 [Chlamydomonas incerta]|uniref:Protein kinase domain-containing protein n=1 Tax=Chlamydomonas incerta TaxID=51695 RepID=A0A835TAL7_CHLIN|nr:hypothetical protein HXX76_007554 [Chlamydomonas incerta]|eukprot:KAG2434661.1 hypothetical protein HXX76_007554 [Chlamydomonas incerta]
MPVVAVGEDGGDGGSGVPAGDASGGSSEAVIGIAVGCALGGAALLALSLGFIWWRRRSSRERGAGEGAVLAGKERQGAAQQGGGLLPDATAEGDGDGAAGKGLEAAAPGEADLESSGGGCSSSTCGGGVRTDGEGESTREATGTADGTAEAPHCVVVKMAGDSSPVINGAVLGGGIDTAQLQQRPLPRPAAPAVGTLQSRHQQQQQPPAGSFIKRMLTAGGSGAGRLQPLSTAAMLCDDDLCGSQALGLSNGSAAQMMGHVAGASASASATTAITADTSAAAHQQLAFLASPVMPTTPYRPDLDLNLSLNTSVALSGELYKAAVISAAAAAAAGGASPDFGGAGPCRLACSPSPAAAEDGGLQLLQQQQQQQQQQQRRWAPPNAKPPTLVNLLLGTQGSGSEAVEVRSRTQTQQLHDGIVLLPDASGRLVAVDSARLALGCYSCGGGGGGEEPAALGSAGTANDSAAVPSGVYIDVGMAQVETAWMVTTNLDADDRGGGEQQQLLLQQAPSQPASATPVQQDLQPQPQQQDEEQPPQGPLTFISNIMQMDARGRERPMTGRGGGGGGGGGTGAAWEHSAPLWGAGGGGSLHRDIDLALLTAAYVSSNANGASDNTLHLLPVVLGRGGCGRVYEGVYRGQKVAVKMLLKGAGDGAAGDTAVLVEALQQEVEVLGRCSHPNVVRLIAACLDRHQPCLVMELCETSLEALIFRGRGGGGSAAAPPPLMPLEQVLNVALGICSALSYMHPTITHRDLKPANVLLNNAASRVPEVKLTDFGLARLRATTMPTLEPEAGTAAYLAPECFDVQNTYVTPHADLYSLGVCIWAMLTGEQPWRDYSVVAVAYKVCSKGERLPMSQLPDARCPPKLRRLVTALFSAHPRRRPAAEEVAKELMLLQQQLYMEQNPRNNGP